MSEYEIGVRILMKIGALTLNYIRLEFAILFCFTLMAVYGKRKIVLLLIMSKKREKTSFLLKSEKCEKMKKMVFLE